MNIPTLFLLVVRRCFLCLFLAGGLAQAAPERWTWTVDGVEREALVALPADTKGGETSAPLVFVFHGHGGTMRHAARTFSLHTQWPEAICVYLQGLPTVGRLTDPEGKKPGWQARAGDQGDRDLKFFDAVLAGLQKEQKVDPKRIYATGHSNGGAFTYLLWGQRGEVFAALAPSAAVAVGQLKDLKPKPVLHLAGKNDPLVRFGWQEITMAALRRLNQCGPGESMNGNLTRYPSRTGCPVFTWIHDGGHEFTAAAATEIVRFFKEDAPKAQAAAGEGSFKK
jgi:polyhydroxybutyrate depolymerase